MSSATLSRRRVFVRDLSLVGRIGVYQHEKEQPQRIVINLDLLVEEKSSEEIGDDIAQVVCYETLVNRVREAVLAEHVELVETMAEKVASVCLEDRRVREVRVSVEKPDIISDVRSVGVEILRASPFV